MCMCVSFYTYVGNNYVRSALVYSWFTLWFHSAFCFTNPLLLLNPETCSMSSSQAIVYDFSPFFRKKCPIPNRCFENTDYEMLTSIYYIFGRFCNLACIPIKKYWTFSFYLKETVTKRWKIEKERNRSRIGLRSRSGHLYKCDMTLYHLTTAQLCWRAL